MLNVTSEFENLMMDWHLRTFQLLFFHTSFWCPLTQRTLQTAIKYQLLCLEFQLLLNWFTEIVIIDHQWKISKIVLSFVPISILLKIWKLFIWFYWLYFALHHYNLSSLSLCWVNKCNFLKIKLTYRLITKTLRILFW